MKKIKEFQGAYRWLSNFEPCDIFFEGEWYPSTEHAYQAAKTLDPNERRKIRESPKPSQAKKLGMTVTLRDDWTEERRIQTMAELNYQKYLYTDLREALLGTGDAILEEGNKWGDTFWGLANGKGRNELGKCLMKIRQYFKENPDVPSKKRID